MAGHREHDLESVSRLAVLAEPAAQRRWPEAMKGRIIPESWVPGVSVRSVAKRYGLKPGHLSSWRGLARAGGLVVLDFAGAGFATVVVADPLPPPPVTLDRIELVVGGITLRPDAAPPPSRITEIVRALNAQL